MRRLFTVARREYLERVRTKAFVISTIIVPVALTALTVIPTLMMRSQRGKLLRVAVLDDTGQLRGAVEEALGNARSDEGAPRFAVQSGPGAPATDGALSAAIRGGQLDGYVHIPSGALEHTSATYYGKNVSNMMDLRLLRSAVGRTIIAQRLTREGLDPRRISEVTRPLDLKTVRLSGRGAREDRGGSFILSVVLMTMLYGTVSIWGAAIMNGVIEEKQNRVVEVVVSSLPAWTLFAGKLIGVGGAGLTQFTVWVASLALLGLYGAAAGISSLPEMSPLLLISFVVFFVLGYFLYGSLYASIGASVNTSQEAQSLVFPVLMPMIMSFVLYPAVLGSPDSAFSVVLSLIPFFAPLLMFLRISAVPPPAWQLALCVAIMLATIAATTWAAARIYRVGILMYGKRPTLPEILKWVRTR